MHPNLICEQALWTLSLHFSVGKDQCHISEFEWVLYLHCNKLSSFVHVKPCMIAIKTSQFLNKNVR